MHGFFIMRVSSCGCNSAYVESVLCIVWTQVGWHAGVQVVQEAPPGQRAALVGFVAAAVRKTLKPHMPGPAMATLTLLLTGVLKGAVLSHICSARSLPDSDNERGKSNPLPKHDREAATQAEQSDVNVITACKKDCLLYMCSPDSPG